MAIQATNAKGVQTPYNDFILHNSRRPNAAKFQAGTAPDVNKGNVLLVSEEDYYNFGEEYVCEQTTGEEAGTFQTWYVPEMDLPESQVLAEPSNGTIRPLDIVNAPAEFGNNASLSTPVGTLLRALLRLPPGRRRCAGLLPAGPVARGRQRSRPSHPTRLRVLRTTRATQTRPTRA